MPFRLTYALDKENLVTTTINTSATDMAGATEEAFEYIEEHHGAMAVLNLVGFSLLKLEESTNESN